MPLRLLGFSLAVLVALIVGACEAAAGPVWLSPSSVSEYGFTPAGQPDIAVDGAGGAIAVWRSGQSITGTIQAAVRSPVTGIWSPPTDVSTGSGNATEPQVAVDQDGNAIVVWDSASSNTSHVVQASVRSAATGMWGPSVTLSSVSAEHTSPNIAVAASGAAAVAWLRKSGTSSRVIEVVTRAAGSVQWAAPHAVEPSGSYVGDPHIAFDDMGNLTAVWNVEISGAASVLRATRYVAATEQWGPAVDVSDGLRQVSGIDVAIGSGGNAMTVWSEVHQASLSTRVLAAVRAAGNDAWQAPEIVSDATGTEDLPQLRVDKTGDAIAVWRRWNGSTEYQIGAAIRPVPSGVWQSPQYLSTRNGNVGDPVVAVDHHGNAVVVFDYGVGGGYFQLRRMLYRMTGGGWQATIDYPTAFPSALAPQLAINAQGIGVLAWTGVNPGWVSQILTAPYDVSDPPLARLLATPESGVAGQNVYFNLAAFDRYQPMGATTWDFGDGRQGTGAGVNHRYGAPGVYTVSVATADAFGGTTGATRQITISPSVLGAPAPGVSTQIVGTSLEKRIATALSRLLTRHTPRVRALLPGGRVKLSFSAPSAGTLTVKWYTRPGARARRVLIAQGRKTSSRANAMKLDLRLTRAGMQILRRGKSVKAMVVASFDAASLSPRTKAKAVTLRRATTTASRIVTEPVALGPRARSWERRGT